MKLLKFFWACRTYLFAVAVIQLIDIALGRQISFWVPLLAPVGMATWNRGVRFGSVIAVISALALLAQGIIFGSPFAELKYLAFATASKSAVMALFVWLVGMLREQQVGRMRLRRGNSTSRENWRVTL